jgi:hypothetical protein
MPDAGGLRCRLGLGAVCSRIASAVYETGLCLIGSESIAGFPVWSSGNTKTKCVACDGLATRVFSCVNAAWDDFLARYWRLVNWRFAAGFLGRPICCDAASMNISARFFHP